MPSGNPLGLDPANGAYSNFGSMMPFGMNPQLMQLSRLTPDAQNSWAMQHAYNFEDDDPFGWNDSQYSFAKMLGNMALGAGAGGDIFGSLSDTFANSPGMGGDAFSDIANGGSFSGGGANELIGGTGQEWTEGATPSTWGAPDTLEKMITQIPEGMNAESYAKSLGYPSSEGWIKSLEGGGAAATLPVNTAPDEGAMMQQQREQEIASLRSKGISSTPSIFDMIGEFAKGGSLAGKLGEMMGLSKSASSGIGALWNVGSGVYGMYQAEQLKRAAEKAAAAADPFRDQRAQYQARLSALMADPSSITSTPGYEAGNQAVQRSMAAQGYNGSGNMMAALQKYGGDFYDKEVARLAGLSGAGINPGTGGQISLQGNTAAASLAGQSLNRIGGALTQKNVETNPFTSNWWQQ